MKHINIECPQGYEIDKEKSTFEKIVFKEIKNELPKKWEELDMVRGWYTDTAGTPIKTFSSVCSSYSKNLFATKELAEASIALAQLVCFILIIPRLKNSKTIPR